MMFLNSIFKKRNGWSGFKFLFDTTNYNKIQHINTIFKLFVMIRLKGNRN